MVNIVRLKKKKRRKFPFYSLAGSTHFFIIELVFLKVQMCLSGPLKHFCSIEGYCCCRKINGCMTWFYHFAVFLLNLSVKFSFLGFVSCASQLSLTMCRRNLLSLPFGWCIVLIASGFTGYLIQLGATMASWATDDVPLLVLGFSSLFSFVFLYIHLLLLSLSFEPETKLLFDMPVVWSKARGLKKF